MEIPKLKKYNTGMENLLKGRNVILGQQKKVIELEDQ